MTTIISSSRLFFIFLLGMMTSLFVGQSKAFGDSIEDDMLYIGDSIFEYGETEEGDSIASTLELGESFEEGAPWGKKIGKLFKRRPSVSGQPTIEKRIVTGPLSVASQEQAQTLVAAGSNQHVANQAYRNTVGKFNPNDLIPFVQIKNGKLIRIGEFKTGEKYSALMLKEIINRQAIESPFAEIIVGAAADAGNLKSTVNTGAGGATYIGGVILITMAANQLNVIPSQLLNLTVSFFPGASSTATTLTFTVQWQNVSSDLEIQITPYVMVKGTPYPTYCTVNASDAGSLRNAVVTWLTPSSTSASAMSVLFPGPVNAFTSKLFKAFY